MTFSELPKSAYFAVIKPDEEMLLLAKDVNGGVKRAINWEPYNETTITSDTEVQPIFLKKRDI